MPTGTVSTYDVGEIYFEVLEAFTGVKKGARVTIHSGKGGGDCGYWFEHGETYLIYAGGNEEKLGTSICTKTRPLEKAAEDLPILRELARNKTGAKLTGTVMEEINLSSQGKTLSVSMVAGIEVTLQPVSGKGRSFKAKTDSSGDYEIAGIPAGKYKINVPLPDGSKLSDDTRLEIESSGFGCMSHHYATLESKNQITGKVTDENGEPLEDVGIELVSAEGDLGGSPAKDIPSELIKTDENGKFKFSGVPAGRYFLAVNYTAFPDDDDLAYPTAFYPHGNTPAQASAIVIGKTETIKNIVFQLPPKIGQREIKGTVLWENGDPAANVFIKLFDIDLGDFVNGCEQTDNNGEFVHAGYQTRNYRLVFGNACSEDQKEFQDFTLDENTQPFKLIVEKPEEAKKSESERDENPN